MYLKYWYRYRVREKWTRQWLVNMLEREREKCCMGRNCHRCFAMSTFLFLLFYSFFFLFYSFFFLLSFFLSPTSTFFFLLYSFFFVSYFFLLSFCFLLFVFCFLLFAYDVNKILDWLNGKCHLVRIVQFKMEENTWKNEQKSLFQNDKNSI